MISSQSKALLSTAKQVSKNICYTGYDMDIVEFYLDRMGRSF